MVNAPFFLVSFLLELVQWDYQRGFYLYSIFFFHGLSRWVDHLLRTGRAGSRLEEAEPGRVCSTLSCNHEKPFQKLD